ncbi:MAG: tetratricopeptide repeat protein [Deltaproteobacteria bacterium]|nr:tetratricopeptide repeat protein [Deltaproteobacteria bacterium]
MKPEPTLSLFMIVKNEEAMLARCLKSARQYVNEIIIVDTGSTDQSVDIAKKFDAKVYHHTWEGDFAKHRNQAIGYATGDWLLMLDADEELREGSGEILLEAIRTDEVDAIEVFNVSFFNKGVSEAWLNQTRVFKNKPEIRYTGIVHEQLIGVARSRRYPIFLNHYGYDLEKDMAEKKHQRNVSLIKKQIHKEPDNYFHHLNLAVSYSTHFEFQKAVEEGLEAVRLAEDKNIFDHNLLWAKYIVASAYYKLDDLDQAEKQAMAAIELSPDHLDSNFILALVYHRKKIWDKLEIISGKILSLYKLLYQSPEAFSSRLIHMANEEWRIHIGLGDMYLSQGDLEKAVQSFDAALRITSNQSECYRIIGDCFRYKKSYEYAKAHYKSAIEQRYDNAEAIYGLALTYKDQSDDARYSELMESIKKNWTENPEIFCEMGILNIKKGRYESAIDHFQQAIALNKDYFPAYINLALAYKYLGKLDDALDANLQGLRLRPHEIDVLINLGHLYYTKGEFPLAKEIFLEVLERQPDHMDVLLYASELFLMDNNIEMCVHQCDQILKVLGLPCDMTLSSITDLAGLFVLVGHVLHENQKPNLSKKAFQIAFQLDPRIGVIWEAS